MQLRFFTATKTCPSHNNLTLFDGRSTNISYLDFSLKPAVFSCLTNALAPPSIAIENFSRSQMDQPVF